MDTLQYGEELSADHPGFCDQEYRKRRKEICNLSKSYRIGESIPIIDYNEKEKETWYS